MTKKAVELVTSPKRFLHKKKHPALSQKLVMEQQLPGSLQYRKESSERVCSKRGLQN